MATHSSVLPWRIQWTEEPGGLLSVGSHRVGHDWHDLAAACFSWASRVMLVVKNPPVNAGGVRDAGSILGLGRSPGGGSGNPFHYSCLRIPWTEKPGGLWSMSSRRVGHNWSNLACKCALVIFTLPVPKIIPDTIFISKSKLCIIILDGILFLCLS